MALEYSIWATQIERLYRALAALRPVAAHAGVTPPDEEEWFELLERKLLAQVSAEPLLVVALVGGTNIGKSLIFNHLAGEEASGVSPLAARTRHPVCLVPPDFGGPERLEELFTGFDVRPWRSSDDAMHATAEHRLFWRMGTDSPSRLLILDTPDIDSDVEVNWERADHIRQAADVLIAVLTQQKYNDAAVKRFFRKAVQADKPFVVVFNQCELGADAPYWPHWLATFTDETGARPEFVYVVPHDRAAADALELPFYDVGPDGRGGLGEPSSLRDDLATLHFSRIKIRTFRGAAERVLDPRDGGPAYLDGLRQASQRFADAARLLSSADMARVRWPNFPSRLLVDEIRSWWHERRPNWSRRIHEFYRALGRGLSWPVRAAFGALSPPGPDPLEDFSRREREVIVLAVERLVEELQRLSTLGNETLRPRLEKLLTGDARSRLLAHIQQSHAQLPPLSDDYRAFVREELDRLSAENPRAMSILNSLDKAAAVARPAITVSLAVSGWVLAGGLVQEAAVQAAGHTASELATEAAITGTVTGGGEAAISTTGKSLSRAGGRLFRRLQIRYAQMRADWLANWLERELLGDLLTELRRGADVPQSAAFAEVRAALDELAAMTSEAASYA